MDSKYLYLLVNLAVIGIPLAFSFGSRLAFFKKWKAFFLANLITLAFFVAWDAWFTADQIWGFNSDYLIGWNLLGLPIEEWLFFICIPYACVFTYEAIRYAYKKEPLRRLAIVTNLVFLIFCAVLCFIVPDRRYPFFTAVFSIIYLMCIIKWKNARINGWFIITYLLILTPFIISNGVLTGLEFWKYPLINFYPEQISDQIVWYNNGHNLRIRIFSMPIDDLLYGFLLLLMNISLYDIFLKRKRA